MIPLSSLPVLATIRAPIYIYMYTYIYYTIYIYYIYIHRYILAYIQPAPRYSICYTRTNRYDCVSLGSLVPPLSFFFLSVHIYIYISYTCTLSISRSPLPLFFLQSSISFFSSVSLVRSRYRGDISVSGLNSNRSPLRSPERERERVFAKRFTGSPSHSAKGNENRENRGRSMRRN